MKSGGKLIILKIYKRNFVSFHSVKMSDEVKKLSAQMLEYREKDNQYLEMINLLKKSRDQLCKELLDCQRLKGILEEDVAGCTRLIQDFSRS